jgi:hypothetical protein
MNDMQIRDTLSTVIEQMHPVATYANGSAIFEELGEALTAWIVELDACRYALTGRIASTQNHPSRRVRIIDDPVESVTLEDGRERPMLQMVKPDWLYDENGDKRGD